MVSLQPNVSPPLEVEKWWERFQTFVKILASLENVILYTGPEQTCCVMRAVILTPIRELL